MTTLRPYVTPLVVVVAIHAVAALVHAQDSAARDANRILAAKCFQCHGPDAARREADLRLDTLDGSTQELSPGEFAIVPGEPSRSQVVARIEHEDPEQRMPPPTSNQQLTPTEIETLRRWIRQGADYPAHWAFTPLDSPSLPSVRQAAWVSTPVDQFILARLEERGLAPPPPADRYTLVRRVYFDLIGLPPTPQQITQFVNDPAPDAWAQLIDRLLSSPHYGERWGRHWLDVARYGDSNGGDENHAYPHAYHYRDYVIDAFNADTAYDRFLSEQLAGDLLMQHGQSSNRLAATGFLAIGMKILAEQDPAKKRADMVDEQIDTFGRSILGLTLGCARCHDHKFDPISTADYYALFGIFQSTDVKDRELETASLVAARKAYETNVARLTTTRKSLQNELDGLLDGPHFIQREAETFERGNVIIDDSRYGVGIGIISDPSSQTNYAEYDIEIQQAGEYRLQLRYAAFEARPGRILIDGTVVDDDAISQETGGWMPEFQQWFDETEVTLTVGIHTLRIESKPMMSHLDKLRLIPIAESGAAKKLLDEIAKVNAQISALSSRRPTATQVMSVDEGTLANARIHLRGDHRSLGDEVPRRFLEVLGSDSPPAIPDSQSGRLQLAQWLTDSDGIAAGLTSRVMANRLWHWHFGRGLVATPDQFGVKGSPPTHPRLLDYLARELMTDGWSLKSLHRQIVLSRTYQSSSQVQNPLARERDPANQLYWRADRRRLEAESLRDAILLHAERLDRNLKGAPLKVKSQDPSPADLEQNQQQYYACRRRSVYLPVVRTNLFKFLTLFDFPNAATPVGRRSRTTVPTQSLWLMNSPFMIAQAQHIAASLAAESSDCDERLSQLHLRFFSRPIDSAARARLRAFLARAEQQRSEDVDARQTAWTLLCHSLMMSHDFIYLD